MADAPVISLTLNTLGGPTLKEQLSFMKEQKSLMVQMLNLPTASNPMAVNIFEDGYPFSYDKDTTQGRVVKDCNGNILLFPNPHRDLFEREAKTLCEALNMYQRMKLLDGRD